MDGVTVTLNIPLEDLSRPEVRTLLQQIENYKTRKPVLVKYPDADRKEIEGRFETLNEKMKGSGVRTFPVSMPGETTDELVDRYKAAQKQCNDRIESWESNQVKPLPSPSGERLNLLVSSVLGGLFDHDGNKEDQLNRFETLGKEMARRSSNNQKILDEALNDLFGKIHRPKISVRWLVKYGIPKDIVGMIDETLKNAASGFTEEQMKILCDLIEVIRKNMESLETTHQTIIRERVSGLKTEFLHLLTPLIPKVVAYFAENPLTMQELAKLFLQNFLEM